MEHKNTYTGSKIQNQFTAYLLKFVRGKRRDYFDKMIKISNAEELTEDFSNIMQDAATWFEQHLDFQEKEELLINEAKGEFPNWNEMSNQKLVDALLKLRDDERRLIYQHVFEEKSFEEMSLQNSLPEQKVKGIYYYAIRKIRNIMKDGETE